MPDQKALTRDAVHLYRDLLEQGKSPAQANAHVQIQFGRKLPETWQRLIEQNRPLPEDTF